MATVVFDNNGGAGDGKWSTATNWVGDALPGDADVADIDENCTLDQDDVVAQLDIASGKTLTMNAGCDITGMTASCLGAGTISMGAGCSLKWNSASDLATGTVNITARGTSGSRCTIDNTGAGRFDLNGSSCSWDCEYLDLHSILRFLPAVASPSLRFIHCDLEGGKPGVSHGTYFVMGGVLKQIENCWISNFNSAYGACWISYGNSSTWRASNLTFGRDRDGNSQPNTIDLYVGALSASGASGKLTNAIFTAATPLGFSATANSPWDRVVVENYGYNPNDATPGTPGTEYLGSLYWTIQRSTANPPAGKTYHARLTPKSGLTTHAAKVAQFEVSVPVASGDDISVTAKASRSTTDITAACADVVIDPEGAWFTPTTVAWDLTNADTYYDLPTCEASNAGGTGAKGTVRVAFRLKEYSASDYLDIGDITITCGGTAYVVSCQNWANGMPVPDEPAASSGGGGAIIMQGLGQIGLGVY